MIGYTYWMAPSEEQLARQQFVADSIAQVNKQRAEEVARQTRVLDEAQKIETQIEEVTTATSDNYAELKNKYEGI